MGALIALILIAGVVILLARGKEGEVETLELDDLPDTVIDANRVVEAAQTETVLTEKTVIKVQETILDEPRLEQAYQGFSTAFPSAKSHIEQAQAHIAGGTATAEDIVAFNATLQAYQNYAAKGGEKSYDSFIINPPDEESKAIIQSGRDAATELQVADILASHQSLKNLYAYTQQLSPNNPIRKAIEAKVPSLAGGVTEEEAIVYKALKHAANYGVPAEKALYFYNLKAGEKIDFMKKYHYGGY